jgi:hypothetical protein
MAGGALEEQSNICIGYQAGYPLTTGWGNVMIGYKNGQTGLTEGRYNTGLGSEALRRVETGHGNVGISRTAGFYITTGGNNICIGKSTGGSSSPSGEITTQDNIICLGDNDITSIYCADTSISSSDSRDKAEQTNFSGGLDWVNAMQPITYYWDKRAQYCEPTDPTLEITTSIANTFTVGETITGQSSGTIGTFKSGSGDTITFDMNSVGGAFEASETIIGEESEIEATVAASDFYNDGEITSADVLAAVPDGTHKGTSIQIGFSAQDILDIEQAHGYGSDNDDSLLVDLTEDETRYSLRKTSLIPMLVNAIKELSTKNDALEARIVTLEG